MKHLKRILLVSLLITVLCLGSVAAQTQYDCGVLIDNGGPAESIADFGGIATFGPYNIPAESYVTLEAETFTGDVLYASIEVDGKEIAYGRNADDRSANTLTLSYYFTEETLGLAGGVVWKSGMMFENVYTLTVDCPSQQPATARSESDATFTRSTSLTEPQPSPDDTEDGPAEGVSFTRYNLSLQIVMLDEAGRRRIITYTPSPDLPSPSEVRGRTLLLAGNENLKYVIYRLPNGKFQVVVGPDERGRIKVTGFDSIPPTRTEHYETPNRD
jgi:hypothetical protein